MKIKIGLLGCGNLVNAIIRGYVAKEPFHEFEFNCYTPSEKRAFNLAKDINGKFCNSKNDLKDLDIYLFGFKPQNYEEAKKTYAKIIPKGATIWSLLAGVSTEKIQEDFPFNHVLRIMPNTASYVQKGISLYHYKEDEKTPFPGKTLNAFKKIFEVVSNIYFIKTDDLIDRVTGVSASGPALLFEVAIQLSSKLIMYGIEKDDAQRIVKDLFIGTGKLLEKDLDAKKLKEQVTSKKGVTYEALEVFRKNDLGDILHQAIDAAYKRSKELRS